MRPGASSTRSQSSSAERPVSYPVVTVSGKTTSSASYSLTALSSQESPFCTLASTSFGVIAICTQAATKSFTRCLLAIYPSCVQGCPSVFSSPLAGGRQSTWITCAPCSDRLSVKVSRPTLMAAMGWLIALKSTSAGSSPGTIAGLFERGCQAAGKDWRLDHCW